MTLRNLLIVALLTVPLLATENVKSVGGVAKANIKSIAGVAEANIKAVGPVDNTSSGGGGTIGPVSVAADADDGEIFTASFFWSDGQNADGIGHISNSGGNGDWCFFRFILPSGITSGATITSATFGLWGEGTVAWSQGVHDLFVTAADSANAAAPTSGADRPAAEGGGTATTTATIAWDNVTWTTDAFNNISVTTLIQELVTDNGGLSSSAGIVIWIRAVPGAGEVLAQLNEFGGEANTARLTIVWTP